MLRAGRGCCHRFPLPETLPPRSSVPSGPTRTYIIPFTIISLRKRQEHIPCRKSYRDRRTLSMGIDHSQVMTRDRISYLPFVNRLSPPLTSNLLVVYVLQGLRLNQY